MRHHFVRAIALFALPLALAACEKKAGGPEDLDTLDNELTDSNSAGNVRDPALTAALHDQIMVDPALTQSANANTIRPPSRPDGGAVPVENLAADKTPAPARSAPAASGDCPDCKAKAGALTLGALAERQRDGTTAGCGAKVAYSAAWANRLPAGIALYPQAQVSEAAGSDAPGCTLRIVSFATAAPMKKVIDWYYTRTTGAGYSAEHRADGGQHVLGGARGHAAYMIYFTARQDGGTDVDLVANGG